MARHRWLAGLPLAGSAAGALGGKILPAGNSCFDGIYTADRCCLQPPEEDAGCWKGIEAVYSGCCDEEAKSQAKEVHRRMEASRDPQLPFAGCFAQGGSFRLAGFMTQGAPAVVDFFKIETLAAELRRLQWRQGQAVRRGRCASGDGRMHSADLLLELHSRLAASGVPLAGWVVNLGAGFAEDSMYVFARRNISGIFVDPTGPPRDVTLGPSVRFVEAAAEPGNLCSLLLRGGLRCSRPGAPLPEVDFLKVDIDSCDCTVATAALRVIRPKVVMMEINMSIPPPVKFSRQCHPAWREAWHRWLYGGRTIATLGCSLSQAVADMRLLGYSFYGLVDALDAIFVRSDVAELLGGADVDEIACYEEALGFPVYYLPSSYVREWTMSPPEESIGRIWCNLTLHDWMLGLSHMPFSLSL